MNKCFILAILLCMAQTLHAQIGASHPGGSNNIGQSYFGPSELGRSTTPACASSNDCDNTGCSVFVFIGSGDWRIAGNWANGMIPSSAVKNCYQIIINPADNNPVVLPGKQTMMAGSTITVMPGKKLFVNGDLLIGQ
ncbi:MAG TPA: hypothetical protein VLC98_02845 [Phnomibacter sp.]|nr:hypothetical protein [Phnomibacter sp.]